LIERPTLNLNTNNLAQEWRNIPIEIDEALRSRPLAMPLEEAWREISALKNFSDEPVFPELTKLARCAMTLPHSNAEAERIFSIVTDAKSKRRNRMGVENLNAIAVVRSSFSSKVSRAVRSM